MNTQRSSKLKGVTTGWKFVSFRLASCRRRLRARFALLSKCERWTRDVTDTAFQRRVRWTGCWLHASAETGVLSSDKHGINIATHCSTLISRVVSPRLQLLEPPPPVAALSNAVPYRLGPHPEEANYFLALRAQLAGPVQLYSAAVEFRDMSSNRR